MGSAMPTRTVISRVASVAALLILCAVFTAQGQGQAGTYSKEEQEVRDANSALQEATLRGDVATLDRLFASDVLFIGGDGRLWNKAERLEDFRSRNRVRSSQRLEEPNVRVFGNTAIVGFAGWDEGQRDGRPFESRSYLTRVYLKRDGRWQLVHQQSALLERVR
jgi:ketosteroid isomerase-like protein